MDEEQEKPWWQETWDKAVASGVEELRKDIEAECLRGTKDVKPA